MTTEEIVIEALTLSEPERAEIVDRLLESLPDQADQEYWKEITRRLDDYDSGRTKLIPGPEGSAQVRKSLGL